MFMMYLDLGELPGLFRGRRLWSNEGKTVACFRRSDHFGDPKVPLDEAVRGLVEEKTGRRPAGPIRLLTHLRYFGYCFNPVSFYFCFDPRGRNVESIVAEVTNTPWGERHCYVLAVPNERAGNPKQTFSLQKILHVSPFMDMDMEHVWRFVLPGSRLVVQIGNRRQGESVFEATMTLRRREITTGVLARVLCRYPWMTGRILGAIYFQALRLWMKGAPFFPHPRYRRTAQTEPEGEAG